jgi:hypothetical protein
MRKKLQNISPRNIFIALIIIYSAMGCYTKTKVDLNKLGNKYELAGTWYRWGGYTSVYKGVVSAFKIDYFLAIYENGTYKYKCNDRQAFGTFLIMEDTVIFGSSPTNQSRYLYKIDGHTLTFTKLDSIELPTCAIMEDRDAFAGTWQYR